MTVFLALLVAPLAAVPDSQSHEILANGRPISGESDIAPLLSELGDFRVVRLVGDAPEAADELHRAMERVIQILGSEAGFDVFVLPVGIFEGVVTEARLSQGADPETAGELLYRVWRQSDSFMAMLSSAGDQMEVIGGLCRFHATGKALYTPHLLEFFGGTGPDLLSPELRGAIERLWSGRERLSRASPEVRAAALALADKVLARFDEVRPALDDHYGARRVDLERHILVNMRTFVELEELRSAESPELDELIVREKRQNLEWFLDHRFAGGKLIYLEGRGESLETFPSTEAVFTILLEARPTPTD